MPRFVALACAALLLCACSPDKGLGETKEVTADDYGSKWPLTVDTARVNNVCGVGSPGVGLLVEGHEFVIDSIVSPDDAPKAFLRFWAEDSSQPSGRRDLSPLLDEGKSLCD